jgi:hypothetical protein
MPPAEMAGSGARGARRRQRREWSRPVTGDEEVR